MEGQGEIRFFSILLEKHFGFNFSSNDNKKKINMVYESSDFIINLRPFNKDSEAGGINSKKIRDVANQIRDEKEININKTYIFYMLIIDADTEKHKPAGGFEARDKYLKQIKLDYDIDFKFFLMPNHSSSGNLESLLDKLISEKGKPFYKCLTNYSNCLEQLIKEEIPVKMSDYDFNKKKFEWYIYSMLEDSRAESSLSKRDYSRDDLWNLDSEALTPLLTFLKEHLSSFSTKI